MAHQSTGSLPLPINSRVTMLVELPRRVALWIFLLAIGLASLLDASLAREAVKRTPRSHYPYQDRPTPPFGRKRVSWRLGRGDPEAADAEGAYLGYAEISRNLG